MDIRPATRSSMVRKRISASCWRPARRGVDRRAVPARGGLPRPLLQLVDGVTRGGQEAVGRRHGARRTSDAVEQLRRKARDLKEVVAEQALELRLPKKKHDRGWGRRRMRYPASEKLERSSGWSNSRTCRHAARWKSVAFRVRPSIAGMASSPVASMRWRIASRARHGSGTVSPIRCAMRAGDVTDTLTLALQTSGCDSASVVQRPWLLSDNLPVLSVVRPRCLALRSGHGSHARIARRSSNPGQDRTLAPDAQEPHPPLPAVHARRRLPSHSHYGFLANGHRATRRELCRRLLSSPMPSPRSTTWSCGLEPWIIARSVTRRALYRSRRHRTGHGLIAIGRTLHSSRPLTGGSAPSDDRTSRANGGE